MGDLLKGRKIFVTGGSRGIGEAVVRACTDQGAIVGFTFLDSSERAEDLIKRTDGVSYAYRADSRNLEDLMDSAARFSTAGPNEGINGLVVNAGIYRRASIEDLEPQEWNLTLETNLTGAFNSVKACIPHMKYGSIVMVSSQLAFRGSSYGADYSASKAGMLGFARSLAKELSPDIRVNSVAPGYVDTDILADDTSEKRNRRIGEVPLGRIAEPGDIAGPIIFLLSEMSSYMTGATLDINGGLFIH